MASDWLSLAQEEGMTLTDLFLRLRDLYAGLLRHLYNNPKDIPDFIIHFSGERREIEDGEANGWPVISVTARSPKVTESVIRDLTDIENFENSYTWFRDNNFAVFDFKAEGISPLQFITPVFFQELMRQTEAFGLRKIKISHMFEPLISSGVSEFIYSFYHLDINLLHTLSGMTYEGGFINCTLLVPRYDIRTEKRTRRKGLSVAFDEPVQFSVENLRQIRKMVEISDKYLALVINHAGKISGLTEEDRFPSECKVRLWGHLSWTITYEGGEKLSYYNGSYHIHVTARQKGNVGILLQSLFPAENEETLARIEDVIRGAARQRHGTIILIGSHDTAVTETERLCDVRSAIGISPTDLAENVHLIPRLTAIDGALIMDTACICSCIGAILDGDIVSRGSPARGSRFNSTVNYVKRRSMLGQKFIGIVFSEDGTIDAVSDTRVQRLDLAE
ncbi:MAG: hypothetical protein IKG46_13330 [Solobacterium sp.]|nr:hypothetical protein [Solobacterium sp.]